METTKLHYPLRHLIPFLLALLVPVQALANATILPPPETCFQALTPTSGGGNGTGTGFVGLLGSITAGTGGTAGTYGGVALTGGTGTGATANITVSGGGVTAVQILNPGVGYSVADVLSASSSNIGGTIGFSVPVSSVSINQSLAGGSVGTYVPGTLTIKQTWFNADQAATHQNTNPVALDANGCAIIYGTGSYRFIVKDAMSNTIYDQVTTDTSAGTNSFWAGLAGGTPNAITVTDAGFGATDGSQIGFIPLFTNTGAATLSVSGSTAYPIVKDTSAGAVALTGSEFIANSPSNVVWVTFSSTQQNFHVTNLVSSAVNASPVGAPQGYLNLVGVASGSPVQGSADVTAATTVYYSPYRGNQIPIWNGSSYTILNFNELQILLSASAQLASTIYDVCIFNNGGTPVGVFGPAWSNSGAGTGTRGTGNGTAQLIYQSGLLVNAVSIAANNGSTSYVVPALQCTYVGSISVDATNGQVSAYRTLGGSRKFGVWNNYNRNSITLPMAINSTTWTYNSLTWRESNGATSATVQVFTGLAEEMANVTFTQQIQSGGGANAGYIGVGVNSTTAPSGMIGETTPGNNQAANAVAAYVVPPNLGINNINSLEAANGTMTFAGTNAFSTMYLTVRYGG